MIVERDTKFKKGHVTWNKGKKTRATSGICKKHNVNKVPNCYGYLRCPICMKEINKKHNTIKRENSNPAIIKDYHLKRLYGISLEEYNLLVLEQQNKCAICGEEKPLLVDHDHAVGHVRGLLCRECNFAIGLIKDNPDTCDQMAQYLRRIQ